MVRKLMTAALILTLGLALTACGNETAGTAANRWTGTNAASQEWAIQRQSDARGPLEDRGNGAYHADETGRVDGYHTDSADGTRGSAKEDMKDAGTLTQIDQDGPTLGYKAQSSLQMTLSEIPTG